MGQKSSLPQPARSVSLVLMPDKQGSTRSTAAISLALLRPKDDDRIDRLRARPTLIGGRYIEKNHVADSRNITTREITYFPDMKKRVGSIWVARLHKAVAFLGVPAF